MGPDSPGPVANHRNVSHADRCLTIGSYVTEPVETIRDLGVYFDTRLTMKTRVPCSSVANLFLLSQWSPPSVFESGMSWARGDCSTGVCLHHLSAGLLQLHPSQPASVNTGTTAKSPQRCSPSSLVMNLGPRDHVTSALYELHWLPIQSRIQFKLCHLVRHAIGRQLTSWSWWTLWLATRVVPHCARLIDKNSSFRDQDSCPQNERLLWQHRRHGTGFQLTLNQPVIPDHSRNS